MFLFHKQPLAVQENIAKTIIHNYIASECKSLENEEELVKFSPKIFGFEGETPYLDLFKTFTDENVCYDEEHDEENNCYMFAKLNGEVYRNKKGNTLTLSDFTYELDIVCLTKDNEILKTLLIEARHNFTTIMSNLYDSWLVDEMVFD